MNYKIRITAENQAIVKRIADENGMNPREFRFNNFFQYYTISNNLFYETLDKSDYPELTTDQFIELFDKKETELDKWLKETKAKNLSLEELKNYMFSTKTNIDFVELRNSLGLKYGESLAEFLFNQWNNLTEESPKVETEWQPKRGDRVLVWNNSNTPVERIFLTEIKGSTYPIITVYTPSERKFLNGEEFDTNEFKHMKPLPIEQPKETDFKTKVIDLIEKNINDKQQKLKFVIDKNNLIYEAVLECIVAIQKDLLNQIKQL